ncbi:iron-containing alcohol dehydrogenase [Sulfurospirillum multivorans]|uniref:NADH-dependent butanol dehydrogenase A n=2 Tax=Sulfurospirillum multivorans TaxID=66821 RepID=A0AA86AP85_SULMK|nr:iron-containing alcohol dehydrogenase [Sulfurospirillum multivorans]AHJ13879.1 putative NADH-dependent butanol dehydrogenase A [Sulfurospirillum multivorans DSM 12446]QEH07369.1 putative NADH-dependent butanol dehydrogenase A [Sulfurospirillum multivorans]
MVDFTYHNPTKIEFGKDKENLIGTAIANDGITKVLLCYGSERIKSDGLYKKVTDSFSEKGIEWVELSGIVSNPVLSKVHEGIAIAKEEKVQAVLSIGGGSVLDSAKSIAAGALYHSDVWDFFIGKSVIEKALPVYAIMTLAATGSEMNGFAVVTNDTIQQKYNIASIHVYPRLSILNPKLTKSVPKNYLAYSAVDIIAHVIEGYLTASVQPHFQSRMVEGIIQTVMETTEILLQNPDDYNARAEFTWAATQALNGVTTAGTNPTLFPNHMIEHSLSALFNIAHGAGLAIVIPAWMTWFHTQNPAQFKRFAQKIFGENSAEEGIIALKSWFAKIGAPVSLKEAGISADAIPAIATNVFLAAQRQGASEVYTQEIIETILHNA